MAETHPVLTDTTSNPGITIISINRPQRKNAVDPLTAKRLYEAILAFEEDATQKVCVLTGAGNTFCAGADLHNVAQKTADSPPAENLQPVSDRNLGPMGPSRLIVKKPVIAAVAGYAVAGGLELSLLADIRVVEEDAVFGVFCRRWGVPLIDGGTVRLQAIVGLGRALDMILTGRPVGAQEALAMGLANRVVPKGRALQRALEIAKQLITFPELCMNTDRRSAYYSAYEASSFQDAMSQEFSAGVKVVSKEAIAGAAKFSKGSGRHGSFKEFNKL
ncbi:Putative Enoyl-CoA hydratase/carnithine racemase [Penicillium brasilianum]|uniref:Putative Enoyl-CoA hydratase/carnithine racemase n=1 Tax=Penicillium brasilianum TaxID=104259 RepID=A0A0F7TC93_PENBI|nr:Putative Enoyl-CoA hydratase/carnithine racemase [Penicillium brasilianum]